MAEELYVVNGDKDQLYQSLLPQIEALISSEDDWVANLANVSAALQQAFSFLWVGFYRVIDSQLVLGPFQGPIACTRIAKGAGVCGEAWQRNATIIVPDVDQFPGHIACSSSSKSEIVVPIVNTNNEVAFVLDIDSDKLNYFDETDQVYLERLAKTITMTL